MSLHNILFNRIYCRYFYKRQTKNRILACLFITALLITTLLLPLFDFHKYISVSLIAFVTGIMMLTFSGSLIEDHPFTILMTSGNYRKMLMAIYRLIQGKGDTDEFKRQAINYGLIVISFIIGGVLSAAFSAMYKTKAVWLISTALIVMLIYYCYNIKKADIKYTDIWYRLFYIRIRDSVITHYTQGGFSIIL